MKKLLVILLLCAGPVLAQSREYSVPYEATPSGAAAVLTIQQPATGAADVTRLVSAYVYCSVACAFTLERGGAAATGTAATPVPVNSVTPAAKTTAFTASDAGAGTVIGKYTLPAASSTTLDLSALALFGAGTTKNITLRTASISGTVQMVVRFRE